MSFIVHTGIVAPSTMAALIHTKDWSQTALGPIDRWPPSLTLIVNIMLASAFPMALRWGPELVLIYNDGYLPILGDKHPRALGLPIAEVWPEVQAQLRPLHAAILSGARTSLFAEDLPYKIQRRGDQWDDAYFTVSYSAVPDESVPGGVGGVLVTAVETTKRVRLEQSLRSSEQRQRSAMLLGHIGSWETDFVKGIRTWTLEGMALFGIDVAEGLGHVGGPDDELRHAMHPDDRYLLDDYHALANAQDEFSAEYRIVKADGQICWLSGFGQVLDRQPDGRAHRAINVATDITARKSGEAHQRFLLQELSHRSKNLLTIVQSISDQTLRSTADQKEFQKRFHGRLRGLAASNTLLAQSDWRGTSLAALVELQLAPFVDVSSPQVEIDGPNVDLAAEAGQAIGLALHELATNAVKYGALSVPAGKLSITWRIDHSPGAGGLKLDWREHGGPTVTTPKRTGFGHTVMKHMVEQAVQGTVDLTFAPEGLQWSLRAPASVFLS